MTAGSFFVPRVCAAVSVWCVAWTVGAFVFGAYMASAFGAVAAVVAAWMAHDMAESVRRFRRASRSLRRIDRFGHRNVRVLPGERDLREANGLLAAMAATPQVGPVVRWPDESGPRRLNAIAQGIVTATCRCGAVNVIGDENTKVAELRCPQCSRDDWSRKAPPPLAAVPDEQETA